MGSSKPKKKAHLSQPYDKLVQKLEKVELGDNFTPLLVRVLLCRATGFERTMTHLPSRVNSFFATNFCFLHNRLSTGIFPGFRTLFPALRPEICRATPVLREQERIPHKPLLPFAICAHPAFCRENQHTGKYLALHHIPKKGCCTRGMEQGKTQNSIRNAAPLLQANSPNP